MRKSYFLLSLALLCGGTLVAQDFALKQLNESPRHHEWADVQNGDRAIKTFVALPETNEPTTTVLVIHENRGLTDWVRSFADQIAQAGYVAVAPDLLSDFNPEKGLKETSDFSSADDAKKAIYELEEKQVLSDLKAVRDYAASIKASNGKVVVAGFCWGGSRSFLLATVEKDIEAVFSFYGSPPEEKKAYKSISAPVYGFYGENDNRVNSKIPDAQKNMEKYGKTYEVKIYDGAGHAFMRYGDDPEGSEENKAARNQAWEKMKDLLKKL